MTRTTSTTTTTTFRHDHATVQLGVRPGRRVLSVGLQAVLVALLLSALTLAGGATQLEAASASDSLNLGRDSDSESTAKSAPVGTTARVLQSSAALEAVQSMPLAVALASDSERRPRMLPLPSKTKIKTRASVQISGSSTAKNATATFTVVQQPQRSCKACTPKGVSGVWVAAEWTITGCVAKRVEFIPALLSGPEGVTSISLPLHKPPAGCKSYTGQLKLALPAALDDTSRSRVESSAQSLRQSVAARVRFDVPLTW